MKIGILTFHASHNYGSMLLAYALQTFLQRQGHEVKIINYRTFAQKALYPKPKRANVDEWLKNPKLFLQNRTKWLRFEAFMDAHYLLTREAIDLTQLELVVNEEQFDAIITGGDQIWNMVCNDFSIAYYLPFNCPGVRRISYSPSFGGMNWWKPQHYATLLQSLLGKYDFVSVREKDAAMFLSELLGREIPNVVDPVFLLDRCDYLDLAGKTPIIEEEYLLFYSPWRPERTCDFVANYAKKNKLKVVVTNGKSNMVGNDWVRKNDCGPIEFLNLLLNAKMIIGESFHLAVFSILFHKPFYVISSQGEESRMGGLLKSVGLDSRYVLLENGFPREEGKIDWDSVDAFVNEERKKSVEFLTNALISK